MGLYERIRDLAKLKGYSVNRLEQELGFARSSISKFNKNKPSVDKLRKISDFLDTTMENLMGTESAENDQQGADSLYTASQLYSGSSSAVLLFESEEMINKYRESGTRDIKIYLDFILAQLTAGGTEPAFYDGEALYPETAKLFREDLLIAIERLKIINKAKSICELKKD